MVCPCEPPCLSTCVNCSCKEGGTLKCGEQLDRIETARDMEWAGGSDHGEVAGGNCFLYVVLLAGGGGTVCLRQIVMQNENVHVA